MERDCGFTDENRWCPKSVSRWTGRPCRIILWSCPAGSGAEQKGEKTVKTKKRGNNWTAYYDPDTRRYFAEIMYTSREGREQYDYEITKEIFDRLGSFGDDLDNERLIKDTGKMAYSFENTMYGTLGPERTVWDEEVHDAMNAYEKNKEDT